MNGKIKFGVSAMSIMGGVFTFLGTLFVGLGVTLAMVIPGEEKMIGVIFSAIGSPFLILGIVFLATRSRNKRNMRRCVEEGRFVWAEIVDFSFNYSVRFNGRSPIQLTACYTDPYGTKHLFRSQSQFIFGTRDFLGKQVKVFTDPEKMKPYYVDIQPLLGNYVEH